MRAIELIHRPGITIDAGATVTTAAERMEQAGVGCLVVVDNDAMVGIVTDRDLVRRVLARRLPADTRIDDAMSTPLVSVNGDDDVRLVFETFRTKAVRRLPVVHDGQVAGVVTVDDLLAVLSGQLADIARPVTAEVLFAQHDSALPAVPA